MSSPREGVLGRARFSVGVSGTLPGDTAAAKLRAIRSYAATFGEVFLKSGVTMSNIARALAAFERTLVSKDSPVDRYAAGDTTALGESAVRGRMLFFGGAMCSTCHGGPNFTDGLFHNTGVKGRSNILPHVEAALTRAGEISAGRTRPRREPPAA